MEVTLQRFYGAFFFMVNDCVHCRDSDVQLVTFEAHVIPKK